jgi:hypothetical protein
MENNKLEYAIGNSKIGKDTIIINMGPATSCPSKACDLCAVPRCYALKAEKLYPGCLPYRKRQAKYWLTNGADQILNDVMGALTHHKKVKYIRFNESGDFYSQKCVNKLYSICSNMYTARPDIKIYTYTARKDLKFAARPKNLVINGSGFMIDNNFLAVPEYSKRAKKCAGDCRICKLCAVAGGRVIENLYH